MNLLGFDPPHTRGEGGMLRLVPQIPRFAKSEKGGREMFCLPLSPHNLLRHPVDDSPPPLS